MELLQSTVAPAALRCLDTAGGRNEPLVQPLVEALQGLLERDEPPSDPPSAPQMRALMECSDRSLQVIEFLRPLLLSAPVHSTAAAAVAVRWRDQHAAASSIAAAAELALGRRTAACLYHVDLGLLLLMPSSQQRKRHSLLPILHALVKEAERAQRPKRAAADGWIEAAAAASSASSEIALAEVARYAATRAAATPATRKNGRKAGGEAAAGATRGVPVLVQPTDRAFAAEARKGRPFLITGTMAHWPALSKWKDPTYLSLKAGHRTVPIEVGAAHRDAGGRAGAEESSADRPGCGAAGGNAEPQQLLMTLDEYMKEYVYCDRARGYQGGRRKSPPSKKRRRGADYAAVSAVVPVTAARTAGYLAQHSFFDQVPVLADDFTTPTFCFADVGAGAGDAAEPALLPAPAPQPAINIWFGGEGVGTPLHFDRHSNVLAQVVGCKRVLLVHPKYSGSLYPQHEVENSSAVDVEAPDLKRHPRFAEAVVECVVLQPGQMLYIPYGYWHAVASLSTSISLSFWY